MRASSHQSASSSGGPPLPAPLHSALASTSQSLHQGISTVLSSLEAIVPWSQQPKANAAALRQALAQEVLRKPAHEWGKAALSLVELGGFVAAGCGLVASLSSSFSPSVSWAPLVSFNSC